MIDPLTRLMRRKGWIGLLVILIAWGRMGSNASSLEYELMGEVEYGSGDSLPKCSVNFRVAVSGANWLITITNCHRPDSVRLSAGFPEYGNIHIVFLRQEEAPPADGERSKTEVLISKTARVERYGYPAKAYDRVTQLLWFAFASHTMANGANIPPPLWDLLDAAEGGQNPSEARHFESPLPLPRQAVLFSDGYLARSKIPLTNTSGTSTHLRIFGTNSTGETITLATPVGERTAFGRKWPPPFDAGFTNYTYEVIATTNMSGLVIPIEAVLTQWRPLVRRMTPQLRVSSRHRIVVRSVGPLARVADWSPAMFSADSVWDYRLSSETNEVRVTYEPAGVWLSLADVQRLYFHRERIWGKGRGMPLLLAILFVLALLPPVIIAARSLRSQSRGNSVAFTSPGGGGSNRGDAR